jgi:protein TonB
MFTVSKFKSQLFSVVFLLSISFNAAAQTDTVLTHYNDSLPGTATGSKALLEVMPAYPGGLQDLYRFIREAYVYPAGALKAKVAGQIVASFVIDKDGSVDEIKILKDLGYGTGEELIRVLKKSKMWSPGMQDGRAVRVQFSLPLQLALPQPERQPFGGKPKKKKSRFLY